MLTKSSQLLQCVMSFYSTSLTILIAIPSHYGAPTVPTKPLQCVMGAVTLGLHRGTANTVTQESLKVIVPRRRLPLISARPCSPYFPAEMTPLCLVILAVMVMLMKGGDEVWEGKRVMVKGAVEWI